MPRILSPRINGFRSSPAAVMLVLAWLKVGLMAGCQPRAGSDEPAARDERPDTEATIDPEAGESEPAVSAAAERPDDPKQSLAETEPAKPPAETDASAGTDVPTEAARPPTGAAASSRDVPVDKRSSPADDDSLKIISFDDLQVDIQADMVFEPSMLTDRVRELDGRRVRIRGFIFPAVFQQTGIDQFLLVMNTECKFGPGEEAHHIIIVELVDGVTTSFTVRPITVEGRLTVRPWTGPDGNTWALYHMDGERVR